MCVSVQQTPFFCSIDVQISQFYIIFLLSIFYFYINITSAVNVILRGVALWYWYQKTSAALGKLTCCEHCNLHVMSSFKKKKSLIVQQFSTFNMSKQLNSSKKYPAWSTLNLLDTCDRSTALVMMLISFLLHVHIHYYKQIATFLIGVLLRSCFEPRELHFHSKSSKLCRPFS